MQHTVHTDDQNYPFFAKFIWTKNKYIDKMKSNDLSVIDSPCLRTERILQYLTNWPSELLPFLITDNDITDITDTRNNCIVLQLLWKM